MNRNSKNIILHALSNKKVRLGIVAIIGLIVIVNLASRSLTSARNNSGNSGTGANILGNSQNNTRSVDINQSIDIPIDDSGEKNVTYSVISAELQNTIVIQGQRATPVEGKQFLILNLKLSNTEPQRVRMDTRDFIRLGVNQTADRLAPSIHNDPVELQPISDQYTRLGFSVFTTDTSYTLYLGKIDGDKIEIPLNFN